MELVQREENTQEGRSIVASKLAFFFWSYSSFKTALIFLLFQGDPALGTFVGALTSTAIGLFLVSFIPVLRQSQAYARIVLSPTAKLIGFYVAWMAVTVAWTQAASTTTSLAYWLAAVVDVGIVYMLARMGPVEKVINSSLMGIVTGSVVLGAVALFLTSGTGDNRLGNGEFLNPNVLGNQVAIACLISIALATRAQTTLSRVGTSFASLALLFTLLNTLSKTSIVSFFVAVGIMLLCGRFSLWKKLVYSSGVAVIVYICYSTLSSYLDYYLNETQGGTALDTISGRTLIWERTWEMITAHPWLGYGLLSFRDAGPQVASIRLVEAHNEVLHQWFSYGIVGLMLAVLVYGTHSVQVWRAHRLTDVAEKVSLAAPLLAYCLVRGLTEANLVGLVYPLPLLLMMTLWLRHGGQTRET